jgi:RES domain-containing protein
VKELNCAVLKVPSAVVKGDFNYLINPFHPDATKISVSSQEDFPFDKRIFK